MMTLNVFTVMDTEPLAIVSLGNEIVAVAAESALVTSTTTKLVISDNEFIATYVKLGKPGPCYDICCNKVGLSNARGVIPQK
jgi:hypothetical protein